MLCETDEKKTKFQIARELISKMLSDGDKKSNDIFDACMEAGVTTSMMNYVKKQLSIKSIRKIDDWYWTLNQLLVDYDDVETDFEIIGNRQNKEDDIPVVFLDNQFEVLDWRCCGER